MGSRCMGKLTDKKRAAAFRWMNSLEAAALGTSHVGF